MNENFQISVTRPFGPSIAKVTMPKELIDTLNQYIDKIVKDEKKSKKLDYGQSLAGNVKQEFILENDFVDKSGFLKFLGLSTTNWIKLSGLPKIKKFNLISAWAVRQFKNEYNPIHYHNGELSGVGYLKIPKNMNQNKMVKNKKIKTNGTIDFINGQKNFLSKSIYNLNPKVGDLVLFPNYLMHTAYPFNIDDERRSFSFNVKIIFKK